MVNYKKIGYMKQYSDFISFCNFLVNNYSILFLSDGYVSRLTRQAIVYMRLGKKGQALRVMNRKSTALGMKHAYRSFRLRKWYQVQRQVTTIIRALQNHTPSPHAPPIVEARGEVEGEQIEMVAKTMMVVYSNFSRNC